MFVISVIAGLIGYVLLIKSENSFFISAIGTLLALGAAGGIVFSAFLFAVLVAHFVGEITFPLLGYVCAAPFFFGPIWLIVWITNNSRREYDGRGTQDSEG